MKHNIAGSDRVFRILLGLVLMAFAISGQVGAWVGWVGLVLLATAVVSFCPLYALLGYSPRKSKSS